MDPADPVEVRGTLAFTGINLLRLVVLMMILLVLGGLALEWGSRTRRSFES